MRWFAHVHFHLDLDRERLVSDNILPVGLAAWLIIAMLNEDASMVMSATGSALCAQPVGKCDQWRRAQPALSTTVNVLITITSSES